MALAAKFSGDKAADKIVTASGVAEYKRSTTYSIIDAHVDDIRAALGLDFSEIVEEKQKHTVPKDRMHELVEFLGSDIDRFVKTETSYGFTKLGSTRISRDDNDLHARIEGWYTVTPKVSVKVTPAT